MLRKFSLTVRVKIIVTGKLLTNYYLLSLKNIEKRKTQSKIFFRLTLRYSEGIHVQQPQRQLCRPLVDHCQRDHRIICSAAQSLIHQSGKAERRIYFSKIWLKQEIFAPTSSSHYCLEQHFNNCS